MGVYEELGVKVIINAAGSVTRLGGAPIPEPVLKAFREAAGASVAMDQLQAAASTRIAEATATEAGLVTAGAAAGLTLGAAAILTRYDLGRMERLPHCEGFPNEFVVAREQRSGYDHAVRAAGAKLVEVGFNEIVAGAGVRRTEVWEYEAAFGPNTAGVLYVFAPDSEPALEEVVACAHRHHLPVLVDAAGELPPRANLKAIPGSGADLVSFSGGKAVRSIQSTGILCGKRALLASAALQMLDMDDYFESWDAPSELFDKEKLPGIPRHGIGRGMKVSKEEIVALVTALDLFTSGAYDAENAELRSKLEQIAEQIDGMPACCTILESDDGERWPLLQVELDEARTQRSAREISRRLRAGDPPIYVGQNQLAEGALTINPLLLIEEQHLEIARRLRLELSA